MHAESADTVLQNRDTYELGIGGCSQRTRATSARIGVDLPANAAMRLVLAMSTPVMLIIASSGPARTDVHRFQLDIINRQR